LTLLTGGLALGCLATVLQGHPWRVLAFVPVGATALAVVLGFAAWQDASWYHAGGADSLRLLCGISAGLVLVPTLAQYHIRLPTENRGNGMALYYLATWLSIAIVAAVALPLLGETLLPLTGWWWALTGATSLAALYAWWAFRREVIEQLLEFPFAAMYRFQAAGRGLDAFPLRGPVLVVANHSSWLDPMWLGKILPRSIVPMMTSVFFDLPGLRWMMVHIIGAIRIEDSRYRREAPELSNAITAIDHGHCVVIFPEGELRKREDKPLKLFGQGAWHILRERPQTPVVVCWIEGGWGSFCSYYKGPPTRNKSIDVRRPITIVVGEPHMVPLELLDNPLRTRQYLMQECLRMRESLGLAHVEAETPAEA
jgi:1-acyl-sn-glycerol-3-phosphate acyltransferase